MQHQLTNSSNHGTSTCPPSVYQSAKSSKLTNPSLDAKASNTHSVTSNAAISTAVPLLSPLSPPVVVVLVGSTSANVESVINKHRTKQCSWYFSKLAAPPLDVTYKRKIPANLSLLLPGESMVRA